MIHKVTLIPGDGIGPEITEAARRVIEASGIEVAWETVEAGEAVIPSFGTPLPAHVLESVRRLTCMPMCGRRVICRAYPPVMKMWTL